MLNGRGRLKVDTKFGSGFILTHILEALPGEAHLGKRTIRLDGDIITSRTDLVGLIIILTMAMVVIAIAIIPAAMHRT